MAEDTRKSESRKLIETLCGLEVPWTIHFSPDAQQVLYSTQLMWSQKKGKDAHPISTLWLADTGKAGSSRQITSGQFRDSSPRWHPRDQSIAFISDRAKAGEKWAIYSLDFQKGVAEGEAHPITDVENESPISKFEFSPDGKMIAFFCAEAKNAEQKKREEDGEDFQLWGEEWPYARLRVVKLDTKETQVLTRSADNAFLSNRHVSDFCWAPDGQYIAIVSTQTPHIEEPYANGSKIAILHVESQDIKELCSFPNSIMDISWSIDGKLYFVSGTQADKVCAGTAVWSVAADCEHVQAEKIAFGVENDAESLMLVAGEPLIGVQHGLEDRIYLLPDRVRYSKAQEIAAFDGAYAHDSDELILAIATSDVNKPAEVYTTTTSGGSLVQLSSHGAVFKYRSFGTCSFLKCPSRDKEVDLDGVFLTPSSFPPSKPRPTVVLIHGGPTDRNTNRFDGYYFYWAPLLLSRGFSVLLTNYRGSTGKGEAFASYSLRGVGKYDYEDVVTITDHAVQSGYADKDRLMVGGISQGGFLSYLCSTRNGSLCPWKFQAAIPMNGITDTDSMALTSDLGGTIEAELSAGRVPWNTTKDDTRNRQASAIWEFRAALEKARETGEMVIPPMLILHSEKDERCPISNAVGFRRALQSAGLPFEYVSYPRQAHLPTEQKVWYDLAARLLRWCNKYIGPGEKTNMDKYIGPGEAGDAEIEYTYDRR